MPLYPQQAVSQAELADLIRPFVRARFNRAPDPASRFGGFLPRRTAIDILHRTHSVDADVRAVTAEGVSVFFYDRCELIAWADIRTVSVVGLDADGNRTGRVEYVPEREAEFARINAGLRRFSRDRDLRVAA